MATSIELKKKFVKGAVVTEEMMAELIDGVEGPKGATGAAGKDGLPGLAGKDGLPGRDGIDGSGAITSVNGKTGVITGLAEQKSVDELTTALADTGEHIGGINVDKLKTNTSNVGLKVLQKKANTPLITFIDDDGSALVWTRLKPIFESRGVPCTLAIVSDFVNTNNFLTQNQILELQNKLGWEIASHEKTHVAMGSVTDSESLKREIVQSKKELLEMGFNVKNIVYPFGQTNAPLQAMVADYYNFGTTTNSQTLLPETNIMPRDFTYLKRTPLGSFAGESNTLAHYKAAVDQAISENSWLIFMTHIAAQDATQDVMLGQTIDYIKTTNAKIINLNDAIEYYGDRFNIEGLLSIDKEGQVKSSKYIVGVKDTHITSSALAGDIPFIISKYSRNHVLTSEFSFANASGMPGNTAGMLTTYLETTSKGYIYQTYRTYDVGKLYTRIYKFDETWTVWGENATAASIPTVVDGKLNLLVSEPNAYTNSSLITTFPNKKISVTGITLAGSVGFPNNSAGILTTYRIAGNGYDYQEFKEYDKTSKYIRVSSVDGSWGIWSLKNKLSSVTVGDIPASSYATIVHPLVGAKVGTITLQPLAHLPDGVCVDSIISSVDSVSIKFFNRAATPISLGNRSFYFSQD